MEELKEQSRRQAKAAAEVVPCVTVTEKNWGALLGLQQSQIQLLVEVQTAAARLATKEDLGVPRPESEGIRDLRAGNAIIGAEIPAGDGALCLGDCEEPIVTGWENERRIFTESLFGAGENEEILSGTVLDIADPIGGAGDFGIDLAYLSADISGMIDDRRPQDSTTMRKQKHKKRALGQKSDERDFEQKM